MAGTVDGMVGMVDMEVGEDMAAEAGMAAAETFPWSDSLRPLIFRFESESSSAKHAQHGISFRCKCEPGFALFRFNQLDQPDFAKRHYVRRRSHHLDRRIK
jgi:hypothetical protein